METECSAGRPIDGQAIVYLSPADAPHEGLPIGNGSLGAMVWMPRDGYELIVNHVDCYDDRPDGHFNGWSALEEERQTSHKSAGVIRIDSGQPVHDRFYLNDFEAKLDLATATVESRAETAFTSATLRAWVSLDAQVGVVAYSANALEPVARRVTLERWGSRAFTHWYAQVDRDASIGLEGTTSGETGGVIWIEQKTRSMTFVTACLVEGATGRVRRDHSRSMTYEMDPVKDVELRIYYTVVTSEECDDPVSEAERRLRAARDRGDDVILREHQKQWKDFWDKSYIALSETYLTNLWYVHVYLMASSNRGRHPAPFIDAIWSVRRDFRAWGHIYHWNQQQTYWCMGAAGHSEIERTYLEWRFRTLEQAMDYARQRGAEGAFYTDICNRRGWQDNRDCVALNRVPGLLLALDAWRYYRFTGDVAFLRERAWPMMLEAARFQLSHMTSDENGRWHVEPSTPYEDDSGYFLTRDCITDLALIRAAFTAVIDAADVLGLKDEGKLFAERLDTLADFTLIDLPEVYIKREDGALYFNREWHRLADYPIDPPFGPTGLGDADRIETTRCFSVGFLLSENDRPYTWKDATRPLEGKYLFRGVQETPVFPANLIGLKDKGSERFAALVTSAKGNWTPSHGHSTLPIVFARLGLRTHLAKYLRDMPELYQHFPQGMFSYACRGANYDALSDCGTYLVADAHDEMLERKHRLKRDSFVHFGFEAGGVFACAVTEMLLQSHDGVIRVFPAMPEDWSGRFRLRAIDGFWVEAAMTHGKINSLTIISERGNRCLLDVSWASALGEGTVSVHTTHGEPATVTIQNDEACFETVAGQTYRVTHPNLRYTQGPCENVVPGVKRLGRAILGKARDF